MGNTPSGSANEGGRSRPPVPATPATPAAPAAWDGPPVYAEAVPVEATPAAPPLSPEALSPSATRAAPRAHRRRAAARAAWLSGSHVQVVDQAGPSWACRGAAAAGSSERARACWNLLHGEEAGTVAAAAAAVDARLAAARAGRAVAARAARAPAAQYDLSVGDLVADGGDGAGSAVAVGDRGVVVGPCEDAAEKAPHKRCRVRVDDGKGTYVYTKGQQARRAPLAGQHVLGDGVTRARRPTRPPRATAASSAAAGGAARR